jgi:hypothetical protein
VPSALYQAFSLQIFTNLKLSFSNQRKPENHGGEQLLTPKFGKETDLWAQISEESV